MYIMTNFKNPIATEWYRRLDINKKIGLKELCYDMFGISYIELLKMFSMLEIISMFHTKLVAHGAIPPTNPPR